MIDGTNIKRDVCIVYIINGWSYIYRDSMNYITLRTWHEYDHDLRAKYTR